MSFLTEVWQSGGVLSRLLFLEGLDVTGFVLSMLDEEPGLFAMLSVFFVCGILMMGVGAKQLQTARLIKNTPPEKVRSIALGRTELRGKARDAGVTFDRPFTEGKCLYYSYSVEEKRVTTEKDDDGNTKTKTEWKTISSHSLAAPFLLDDDTGEVLVMANAGASFHISDENSVSERFGEGNHVPDRYKRDIDTSVDIADAIEGDIEWEPHNLTSKIEEKVPLLNITGSGSGPSPQTSGRPRKPSFGENRTRSRKRRRYPERRIKSEVLPVDEDVYVFGAAKMREDPEGENEDRIVIVGDDETGRFIISDMGVSATARKYILMGGAIAGGGLIASTIMVAVLGPELVAAI